MTIEEFKQTEKGYIICRSNEEYLAILKLHNPISLSENLYNGEPITVEVKGTYCKDLNYMRINYGPAIEASEILGLSNYEIY